MNQEFQLLDDNKSLALAHENAIIHNREGIVSLSKKHAWTFETNIKLSNGINIYKSNDKKVVDLYKEFHKALVATGILITSFPNACLAL